MSRPHRHTSDPVLVAGFRPRSTIVISSENKSLFLRVHRQRWGGVSDYDNGVEWRVTQARIMYDGQHAGSLELREFRTPTSTDARSFFDDMDANSSATSELASTLCSYWPEPDDIFDYGNVVELHRAWMRPEFSNGTTLQAAVGALIEATAASMSLLILKAFPLEYEGNISAANVKAFKRRQRAMMKHYRRLFAVTPFPGSAGEDGWMYRVPARLGGVVPEPESENA